MFIINNQCKVFQTDKDVHYEMLFVYQKALIPAFKPIQLENIFWANKSLARLEGEPEKKYFQIPNWLDICKEISYDFQL